MKADDLEIAYRKYYRSLFIYAFSLTQNKADAEDLVSNAFVKALLSFESGHLKAWLYMVLKNEFYNTYKRKKKVIDDEMVLNHIEDPSDILKDYVVQEQKRWLYQKICELPRKEREIMLLSIQSDFNDQMIAKMMNLSTENIRTIRYRAKQKLIKLCEKEKML